MTYAVNLATVPACVGLLAVHVLFKFKRMSRSDGRRSALAVVVLAALAGGITYWVLPRTEARITGLPPRLLSAMGHEEIAFGLEEDASDLPPDAQIDETWLRERVATHMAKRQGRLDLSINRTVVLFGFEIASSYHGENMPGMVVDGDESSFDVIRLAAFLGHLLGVLR